MLRDAGLSPQGQAFDPRLVTVGFAVHRITIGQVFLPVLLLPPVSIIPLMLLIH